MQQISGEKMAIPQEVMFQNQLQFNMNVPLTTYNMATHFHKPGPITIERATALPPGQGFAMAQLANRDSSSQVARHKDGSASNGFHFSVLSQDRMAAAVQMAQRDLKNQKHQLRNQQAQNRSRSPSPKPHRPQKPIYGTKQWESHRSRAPKKSQSVASSKGSRMGVREHDRNRAPCSTGSQTPPSSPHRQTFLNTKISPVRSDSPPTRDTPSMTRVAHVPSDDIEKLQLEMELCLQQIESVQKRVLSEHNTDFLRRGQSAGQRETSHLVEEEGEERQQMRANEQAHRALRTIYNLQQQLKEVERHAVKLPRDSRATKKSQASQRLTMINKGAVKLLQNFVSQLPQQDLRGGLPSHFTELAELVRQVTLLSAGASPDKKTRESNKKTMAQLSSVETDLMAMVDQVEKLNGEWQKEMQSKEAATTSARQKPPFVTNFKNTKPAFTKEHVHQPQLHRHGNQLHNERKALLQEGIRHLLNAGRHKKKAAKAKQNLNPYNAKLAQPPPPKGYSYKVPTRRPPPSRKGFLLPCKIRPQKTAHLSQMLTHFADPTITANLKASTMLHNPITSHRSKSEPPSPRDRKKVNFVSPHATRASHYASYPGTSAGRGRTFQRSISPQSRQSRSYSPKVHFSDYDYQHAGNLSYHSDSLYSPTPGFTSGDDSSSSPIPSVDFFPGRGRTISHRSLSGGQGSQHRSSRSCSPSAQRRQFFLADADPELMDELFPEDSHSEGNHKEGNLPKTQKQGVSLAPYLHEVEKRVLQKLTPLMKDGHTADDTQSDQEEFDRVTEAIMDEAVNEVTQEVTQIERQAAAAETAASFIDSPTLENIMQALEKMEKENEQLRKRYTGFTFHDSVITRRRYQRPTDVFAEFRSDQPREPQAFEVTNIRPPPKDTLGAPRMFPEELSQEPLIFTKDSKSYRPRVTFQEHVEGDASDAPTKRVPPPPPVQRQVPSVLRPKTLLSMKQTVVERITDSMERFDYYQRGLKQHLGKRKPFDLYESVADNILKLCCEEVAQELEHINADMAENIYTSEFMTESGLPLASLDLADDFETDGPAARNLRDSAAAQRSVEAAVSKTVTSLMLPPDEPEISIVSPKRVVETDTSPPWDTSLKYVYDATALYEASITADKPVTDASQGRIAEKEDDTHLEGDDYDYDDDYTDISDDDDEEDDGENETQSPSP